MMEHLPWILKMHKYPFSATEADINMSGGVQSSAVIYWLCSPGGMGSYTWLPGAFSEWLYDCQMLPKFLLLEKWYHRNCYKAEWSSQACCASPVLSVGASSLGKRHYPRSTLRSKGKQIHRESCGQWCICLQSVPRPSLPV